MRYDSIHLKLLEHKYVIDCIRGMDVSMMIQWMETWLVRDRKKSERTRTQ